MGDAVRKDETLIGYTSSMWDFTALKQPRENQYCIGKKSSEKISSVLTCAPRENIWANKPAICVPSE